MWLKNIKEPIEESNHDKLREYCNERIPEDVSFDIPFITTDKVLI